MYDLDAIESINFEQLATATDRLLLLGAKRLRARTSSTTILASKVRREDAAKTLVVRAQVPGRRWATVKQPLIILALLLLIASVVWAAATIAGPAAASAVALSGVLGGAISGLFAHKGVRRARA
jgi:membrane associated rhomboid family serine protease